MGDITEKNIFVNIFTFVVLHSEYGLHLYILSPLHQKENWDTLTPHVNM